MTKEIRDEEGLTALKRTNSLEFYGSKFKSYNQSNYNFHYYRMIVLKYFTKIFSYTAPPFSPFQHGASIRIFWNSSHGATVLQRHALQKLIVNIVAHPDGKDAELLLHSCLCVSQNDWRLDHTHCGTSISQEDYEGHAVVIWLLLL